MGNDDDVNSVLARLPNGARVLSTLLTDQAVPGHVYRVVGKSGTILGEFSTLVELNTFLSHYTSRVSD
jgi:hypothetical protein